MNKFIAATLSLATQALNLNNIDRGTENELDCTNKNSNARRNYWEFNQEACACILVWRDDYTIPERFQCPPDDDPTLVFRNPVKLNFRNGCISAEEYSHFFAHHLGPDCVFTDENGNGIDDELDSPEEPETEVQCNPLTDEDCEFDITEYLLSQLLVNHGEPVNFNVEYADVTLNQDIPC